VDALGSGIIAGLLTTLIVVVFHCLWIRAIQPWYEERIYKDARIEGCWKITYPNIEGEEIAKIERQGHRITGNVTVISGPDQGKMYVFSGTFKNLILTGEYSSANRAALDRGTFSVMLSNNGNSFSGFSSFYHDSKNGMGSEECKWDKQNG